METQISDEERIALEQMSPRVQSFLGEIGRSGVSDTAFKLALLIVPMLRVGSWQRVFLGEVAKRAGVSRRDATIAVSELVCLGALNRRQSGSAACRIDSFRLRERFWTRDCKPTSSPHRCKDTSDPSQ